MSVHFSYSDAVFGSQSTVNGNSFGYNSVPPTNSTWSFTGSNTTFVVRENDGAVNFNGDVRNERVHNQEQIGSYGEQVVEIGGTYYQTIWDYTFEIEDDDGNVFTVGVIDVDFNNDDDLNDANEDGFFLVFPDGMPTAGVNYTVNGMTSNSSATSHEDMGATVVCFTKGTMITTRQGPKRIENLRPGEMIRTRDHGYQRLRWIGQKTVPARGDLAPIRIAAGVLGNARDLLVSPQHRMLVSDWRVELVTGEVEALIPAKDLVNGLDIMRQVGGDVTYVHILFDAHQIVYAEGCASESLHPGNRAMDALADEAHAEVVALFPELAENAEAYGPAAMPVVKGFQAACITQLTA